MWEWWNVDYCENPSRGIGQVYGYSAIVSFLNDNSLTSIIRAHEVARDGYSENWMRKNGEEECRKHAYVYTVFSAPNYCGWYNNHAAILNISKEGEFTWNKFTEVYDKPYILPKNMNAISYSLPWVMETTTKLILDFFSLILEDNAEKELNDVSQTRTFVRSKILTLSSLSDGLHQIHENDELLVTLRGLYGKTLPDEVRNLTPSQIKELLAEYSEVFKLDKSNEMHPNVEEQPQLQSEKAGFWRGESRRTGLTPRDLGVTTPRDISLTPRKK